ARVHSHVSVEHVALAVNLPRTEVGAGRRLPNGQVRDADQAFTVGGVVFDQDAKTAVLEVVGAIRVERAFEFVSLTYSARTTRDQHAIVTSKRHGGILCVCCVIQRNQIADVACLGGGI